MFGYFRLMDTRIGLILIYCLFNLPFAIWLLQGMVDSIPKELDEAVEIDGGSAWSVLWYVILPLAKPGLVVTAILIWVFAWNSKAYYCWSYLRCRQRVISHLLL